MNRNALIREISDIVTRRESTSNDYFINLHGMTGVSRYVNDAISIMDMVPQCASVLDIGCGAGHMAYLMTRLGLSVTASDVPDKIPYFIEHNNAEGRPRLIPYIQANILTGDRPVDSLGGPYDAICASGVLEHVTNLSLFLLRLSTLLKPGGKLFLFRFPNRYSWIEYINEIRFSGKTDHPLRFTLQEVNFMLRWHGYKIIEQAYEEILPVNMTGIRPAVAKYYRSLGSVFMAISKILCRVPAIRSLSTSFRIVCSKAF